MKNWIPTTISIAAIGIAIVAMARVAPCESLDFDYYGAIIGVLSFLVTLLIGYQIYTVINVKKELDEVRQIRNDIDANIHNKTQELSKEFKEELSKAVPILIAISTKDRNVIEKTVFRGYKESNQSQLTKELAGSAIYVIIEGFAGLEENQRQQGIEELARNVNYDEVVEYYTDFSKGRTDNKELKIEQFLLDLMGVLIEKK